MNTSVAERAAHGPEGRRAPLERREALAEIAVREMGKPMEQALGEVDFCGDIYGYYAERAEDFLKDEPIDLLAGEGTALIRRSSMGPLIGIMPWNFPYYQVARFAGPNLIVGNTILLKPAPQCPESAEAIQAIYDDAGFPAGAYQTILATNDQIADAIADPRVRGVSLTGSERAGAAVAEIAGRNLKKVVLELGGSDPFILLATDDLDEAVGGGGRRRASTTPASRATRRSGSSSPTTSTTTSSRSSRRRWREAEAGDPTSDDAAMGPLSSTTAAERLQDQLDRAVAQGAEVALRGERKENFFPTTVLTGITPDNDAYREEFFGPVASVYRSAPRRRPSSSRTTRRSGSARTSSPTTPSRRSASRTTSTPGWSSSTASLLDGAELPFGGVKRSGFGRELGTYGMDEFVNKKLIRVLK